MVMPKKNKFNIKKIDSYVFCLFFYVFMNIFIFYFKNYNKNINKIIQNTKNIYKYIIFLYKNYIFKKI